jgi:hypothetical protein
MKSKVKALLESQIDKYAERLREDIMLSPAEFGSLTRFYQTLSEEERADRKESLGEYAKYTDEQLRAMILKDEQSRS